MFLMITILSYDEIQNKLRNAFRNRYSPNTAKAMVGILFAPPHAPLSQKEIIPGLDYYFHRSGNIFDFFCAGYADKYFADSEYEKINLGNLEWGFSNKAFNEVRKEIERVTTWKYSGEVDLILATASYENEAVTLDYENAIVMDIDKMIRDEAIESVRRLFEEIIGFVEQNSSDDPLIKYSDFKSFKVVGKSLVESLLLAIPKALSNYFEKGWQRGKHYQVLDLMPQ